MIQPNQPNRLLVDAIQHSLYVYFALVQVVLQTGVVVRDENGSDMDGYH
jgi:hypothetical protein